MSINDQPASPDTSPPDEASPEEPDEALPEERAEQAPESSPSSPPQMAEDPVAERKDGDNTVSRPSPGGDLGAYIAVALGSALLAAIATTAALWLSGAFQREEVRITEYVEVPVADRTASPQVPPSSGADSTADLPEAGHDPAPAIAAQLGAADLVAEVAERAIPSIVTVQSIGGDLGPGGSGSGVVIRPDGHIVTNNHVVEDADQLKVIMSDGLSYPAELVGADPLMDIAVLKLEASGLRPIEFGSIDGLRTGEPAIAVGNPLGLDGGPSVTAGVISAFNRSLVTDFLTGDTLFGLLQTDAPITRGSSGGALLDSDGRLLGITTAIGLSDVGAEGLGFAVPINLVESIVNDLISGGEVRHAFLGIRGSSAFDELDNGVESPLGVGINLLEDSALGTAGAEDGDIIVALDGLPVRSMPLLVARLRQYRAGDPVTVTLERDGKQLDIKMTLDRYPS